MVLGPRVGMYHLYNLIGFLEGGVKIKRCYDRQQRPIRSLYP